MGLQTLMTLVRINFIFILFKNDTRMGYSLARKQHALVLKSTDFRRTYFRCVYSSNSQRFILIRHRLLTNDFYRNRYLYGKN
jgi:hypothetical protein